MREKARVIEIFLLLLGQDLKLPAEVKGEPAAFITVLAETQGKSVKFFPLDTGLSVFPAALLANPKATVVTAAQPGRYKLLAYTAVGESLSDPVICTVVIGGSVPLPPGPVDDPLATALAGMYGGLQEVGKAQTVLSLAKVFRSVDPAKFADIGGLYAALTAAGSTIPKESCRPLRERIGDHLAGVLGDDPAKPLTDDLRAKARAELARVATILEKLQ